MIKIVIFSAVILVCKGTEVKENGTYTTEIFSNETSTIKNEIKEDDMLRITQPSSGAINIGANIKVVDANDTESLKKSAFKASPQLESYFEYNRFPVPPAWPESKHVKTYHQLQNENQIRLGKNHYHTTKFYSPTTNFPITLKPWSFAQDKQSLYPQLTEKPLRSDNDISPLKFYDKFNYGAPTVPVFSSTPSAPNYEWFNSVSFPKPGTIPDHPYPFEQEIVTIGSQQPLTYDQQKPIHFNKQFEQKPLTFEQQKPVGFEHQTPLSFEYEKPPSFEQQKPLNFEQKPISFEQQTPSSFGQRPGSYEHQKPGSYEQKQVLYDHAPVFDHDVVEVEHVEKKNPWKKVVKFLTAIIPIGLLLTALTPNVLNIGPAYNATQYCRKDGARIEDGNVFTHLHITTDKLESYECAAKELCETSIKGSTPSIESIRNIVALATTHESDLLQLDIVSKAVKQKNCDIISCPTRDNQPKQVIIQKQTVRRKSRIND